MDHTDNPALEPTHGVSCVWQRTTSTECEYRDTHNYCPHPEHACSCPPQQAQHDGDRWRHVTVKAGNPRVVAIEFETEEKAKRFIESFTAKNHTGDEPLLAKPYHEHVIERLKTPEDAAGYLAAWANHPDALGDAWYYCGKAPDDPIHLTAAAQTIAPVEPSCWHCGVVLAYAPKLRCEDCPDECDIEGCDADGCAPSPTDNEEANE